MRDEEAATQLCVHTGIRMFKTWWFFSYTGEPEEPKGSGGYGAFILHSAHTHADKYEVCSRFVKGAARPLCGEAICAQ